MLERCVELCTPSGTIVVVTPQNWLFLNSYKKLRKALLSKLRWPLVAKLGSNAFRDMNWWAAITLLGIFENNRNTEGALLHGIDVGHEKDQNIKATLLQNDHLASVRQSSQLSNPDHAIIFEDLSGKVLLADVASTSSQRF